MVLRYIANNKIKNIYLLLLVIFFISVFSYIFLSEKKHSIKEIKNTNPNHRKSIILQQKEPFSIETSPKIEEVQKEIHETNQIDSVNKKVLKLSTAKVGSYEISINSYVEDDNLSHDNNLSKNETLYCLLKLREKNLVFDLYINKSMLKNMDELFVSVTTDFNTTIVENAYVLKSLTEDIEYSLILTLYDDYVSLSLIPLEKKKISPLLETNNSTLILNKFLEDKSIPLNFADETKLNKAAKLKVQ